MDNLIVWIIIAAFYAPLHYLVPVLLVLFKSDENNRKSHLTHSLIDSTLSMALAFGLVFYLGTDNIMQAMIILLVAMFFPYIRVTKVMLQKRVAVETD